MSDPWERPGVIETYSGNSFDLFDPNPAEVRLLDVAAGLAHVCRFGGHCQEFYSVAHHSIHVSRELPDEPRLQLLGLFHDAGEAYVGDIPRPLKAEFEEFERIEERILDAVWKSVGVESPTDDEWERVMAADDQLLAYEATNLLEDGGWTDNSPELGYDLQSDSIAQVREQFLERNERLLDQL
jgi:5'-deoxynucleotidase YfbR-like HD superfamily hydrolase